MIQGQKNIKLFKFVFLTRIANVRIPRVFGFQYSRWITWELMSQLCLRWWLMNWLK